MMPEPFYNMEENVVVRESCKSSDDVVYQLHGGQRLLSDPTMKHSYRFKLKQNVTKILSVNYVLAVLRGVLATLLLPNGYPDSVCPEYIQFQFWDTLQEACGYFRGILSNQAYLTNLGVGNPDVTVVSAIVLTMILDYVNMVSGLCFAGNPKMIQKFAINQKFWTMFKEVLDFVANSLTLVSIVFSDYTLYILIVRQIIGAWGSVIGGCCHATLVTHIARKNNFSDCNAKEGNQSRTLKFLIIGFGYKFLIFVNEEGSRAFIAFIVLSLGKFLCQYNSLTSLKLRTLSPNRLRLCLKEWRKRNVGGMHVSKIAAQEAIVYPQYGSISCAGSSVGDLKCTGDEFLQLVNIHTGVNHLLIAQARNKKLHVLLRVDASEHDVLRSYIHATLLSLQMDSVDNWSNKQIRSVIAETLDETKEGYETIVQILTENGWDCSNLVLLPCNDVRIEVVVSNTNKKTE